MARLLTVRLAPRFSPCDEIDALLLKIYQPAHLHEGSSRQKRTAKPLRQRPKPCFGHNRERPFSRKSGAMVCCELDSAQNPPRFPYYPGKTGHRLFRLRDFLGHCNVNLRRMY
jgi:hypothetical protein